MRADPMLFYASQSGGSTLDQGEGGGNPFASALVELLARPALTLSALRLDIVDLTKRRSHGYQEPDISTTNGPAEWDVRPVMRSSKRVALVFVYANYQRAGAASLPGALRDLGRIQMAFEGAGFHVTALADLAKPQLMAALGRFAAESRNAEAAAVYLTGHGFEHNGAVYLIPHDYPLQEGPGRLADLGVRVAALTHYLQATAANLLFYGGCRTHW